MRCLLSLLSCSLVLTISAQVDLQKMIQERMAKQQGQGQGQPGDPTGGMKVEDDNDPFVPNTFIGNFRMEMHMFKDPGSGWVEEKHSPTNMRYWSSEDMTLMKTELRTEPGSSPGHDMRMLTDLKGKWQYILMTDEEGKKTAMKSHKKKVTMKEEADTVKKKEPVITVTKETKSIEGHTCTKVIVKSDDGSWTGWVAKDIKTPFEDMTRNMKQRGSDQLVQNYKGVEGFPLEYEWIDAKGNDRIVCYTKELKEGAVDASLFSLDGYEVLEMPSYGQ